MQYTIYGILSNGSTVFRGMLNYVPRKGEEIEANGYVFAVENVRYLIKDGTSYTNDVRLRLKLVV